MADDDVLDRIGAEAFARPQMVDDLQRESFTIHELGVAFAGKILPSMIREIVSRHKIPLVAAMPGGAAEPRRYHLIDAYMIAAFAVFNRELDPATPKAHRPAALAKLRTALHHFLWGGDPMTPAAAEERRAEFKAARTTALKRREGRVFLSGSQPIRCEPVIAGLPPIWTVNCARMKRWLSVQR